MWPVSRKSKAVPCEPPEYLKRLFGLALSDNHEAFREELEKQRMIAMAKLPPDVLAKLFSRSEASWRGKVMDFDFDMQRLQPITGLPENKKPG